MGSTLGPNNGLIILRRRFADGSVAIKVGACGIWQVLLGVLEDALRPHLPNEAHEIQAAQEPSQALDFVAEQRRQLALEILREATVAAAQNVGPAANQARSDPQPD